MPRRRKIVFNFRNKVCSMTCSTWFHSRGPRFSSFGFALSIALASMTLVGLSGCGGPSNSPGAANREKRNAPVFTLAWSEYPSWSVFGVAEDEGLIDPSEGGMGTLEEKWQIDIVLHLRDYDTCISEYGASTADAVCITNMDILAPSVSRPAVCILPTSTSVGADACIVVGSIGGIDGLAGVPTFGLEKSVSQYCFERVLELHGKYPADFPFKNMDPAAAATAMQSNQKEIQSIMVWNPFVMDTLRKRADAKVLFDSSSIEEEIIDMVAVAKDSLARDGGDRFANALVDAFYTVNKMMDDPKTRQNTLVALGARFSKLSAEDMETVVQQTRFYNTPAKALALLNDDKFIVDTMPAVAEFLLSHDMADKLPTFGLNAAEVQLNFDTQFLSGMAEQ
jgi:ABC-type nitrate/sulfonate/bicarbonate transport system substrate-binding protein